MEQIMKLEESIAAAQARLRVLRRFEGAFGKEPAEGEFIIFRCGSKHWRVWRTGVRAEWQWQNSVNVSTGDWTRFLSVMLSQSLPSSAEVFTVDGRDLHRFDQ